MELFSCHVMILMFLKLKKQCKGDMFTQLNVSWTFKKDLITLKYFQSSVDWECPITFLRPELLSVAIGLMQLCFKRGTRSLGSDIMRMQKTKRLNNNIQQPISLS